jgi:hypothetical protein
MSVVNMPGTVDAIQCSQVAEDVCKVKCPGGVASCLCASNPNVPAFKCAGGAPLSLELSAVEIALALGVIALIGVIVLASALFLVHRALSRKLDLVLAASLRADPNAQTQIATASSRISIATTPSTRENYIDLPHLRSV